MLFGEGRPRPGKDDEGDPRPSKEPRTFRVEFPPHRARRPGVLPRPEERKVSAATTGAGAIETLSR
jgi:hypothetical protein